MYIPEVIQNRTYLITIIALITTIAALGPFFLEDVACSTIPTPPDKHGHMSGDVQTCWQLLAHETLHIAAITFGVFLSILGMIAYNSTKNTHMVFTTLAFVTFTVLSIFLLYADLNADRIEHEEAVFEDVLLTVMIGFFAMGVFSNQKFKAKKGFN